VPVALQKVEPQVMRFSVQEVNQAASGGSYVCVFDAEVEWNSGGEISVSVETVEPPDTELEYITEAGKAIRAGAAYVLDPLDRGATIRITRLVVNHVDFKPSRFTLYAAREFKRLVDTNA
jgi:hypothetical protein